jgi:hypothetical protein
MPGIKVEDIQQIVDQIETFKKAIATAGEEGRNKLKSVNIAEVWQKIPFTADKKVDPQEWPKKSEDEKNELCQQLTLVRDALQAAAQLDGPTDPKHIMSAEYASNTSIVLLTLTGFLFTALLLIAIVFLWDQATGNAPAQKDQSASESVEKPKVAAKEAGKVKAEALKAKDESPNAKDEKTAEEAQKPSEKKNQETPAKPSEGASVKASPKKDSEPEKPEAIEKKPISESIVLTMVILLGALGGSLHLVSSLVKFIGNRQLKRSWLAYYLAMPFTGAGLAPIIYMLLRVGLLNPSGTSATSGTGFANLNLLAIYAFAVLTGLFSRVALDKLGEVFGTIFRTQAAPSKDALGPQKPPGGTAPAGGKTP